MAPPKGSSQEKGSSKRANRRSQYAKSDYEEIVVKHRHLLSLRESLRDGNGITAAYDVGAVPEGATLLVGADLDFIQFDVLGLMPGDEIDRALRGTLQDAIAALADQRTDARLWVRMPWMPPPPAEPRRCFCLGRRRKWRRRQMGACDRLFHFWTSLERFFTHFLCSKVVAGKQYDVFIAAQSSDSDLGEWMKLWCENRQFSVSWETPCEVAEIAAEEMEVESSTKAFNNMTKRRQEIINSSRICVCVLSANALENSMLIMDLLCARQARVPILPVCRRGFDEETIDVQRQQLKWVFALKLGVPMIGPGAKYDLSNAVARAVRGGGRGGLRAKIGRSKLPEGIAEAFKRANQRLTNKATEAAEVEAQGKLHHHIEVAEPSSPKKEAFAGEENSNSDFSNDEGAKAKDVHKSEATDHSALERAEQRQTDEHVLGTIVFVSVLGDDNRGLSVEAAATLREVSHSIYGATAIARLGGVHVLVQAAQRGVKLNEAMLAGKAKHKEVKKKKSVIDKMRSGTANLEGAAVAVQAVQKTMSFISQHTLRSTMSSGGATPRGWRKCIKRLRKACKRMLGCCRRKDAGEDDDEDEQPAKRGGKILPRPKGKAGTESAALGISESKLSQSGALSRSMSQRSGGGGSFIKSLSRGMSSGRSQSGLFRSAGSSSSLAVILRGGASTVLTTDDLRFTMNVVAVLRNLACSKPEIKDMILNVKGGHVAAHSLRMLKPREDSGEVRDVVAGLVRNLSSGKERSQKLMRMHGFLDMVREELTDENSSAIVRRHLLATLQNFADYATSGADAAKELGRTEPWMDLCMDNIKRSKGIGETRVIQQAIATLGNFALVKAEEVSDDEDGSQDGASAMENASGQVDAMNQRDQEWGLQAEDEGSGGEDASWGGIGNDEESEKWTSNSSGSAWDENKKKKKPWDKSGSASNSSQSSWGKSVDGSSSASSGSRFSEIKVATPSSDSSNSGWAERVASGSSKSGWADQNDSASVSSGSTFSEQNNSSSSGSTFSEQKKKPAPKKTRGSKPAANSWSQSLNRVPEDSDWEAKSNGSSSGDGWGDRENDGWSDEGDPWDAEESSDNWAGNSGWGNSAHSGDRAVSGDSWGADSSADESWGTEDEQQRQPGQGHAANYEESIPTEAPAWQGALRRAEQKVPSMILESMIELLHGIKSLSAASFAAGIIASLSNFAQDPDVERSIGELNGIATVLGVMYRCPAKVVRIQALRFLWNMTSSRTNQAAVLKNEGLQHILDALRDTDLADSPRSPGRQTLEAGLQEQGCGVLRNLATGSGPQKRHLLHGGIVPVLVNAIRTYPAESGVCLQAAAALHILGDHAAPVAIEACSCGAVEALLQAVKCHSSETKLAESTELLEHLLAALKCMVSSSRSLGRFRKKRGHLKVLAMLKAHTSKESTLVSACRVLATVLCHRVDGQPEIETDAVSSSEDSSDNEGGNVGDNQLDVVGGEVDEGGAVVEQPEAIIESDSDMDDDEAESATREAAKKAALHASRVKMSAALRIRKELWEREGLEVLWKTIDRVGSNDILAAETACGALLNLTIDATGDDADQALKASTGDLSQGLINITESWVDRDTDGQLAVSLVILMLNVFASMAVSKAASRALYHHGACETVLSWMTKYSTERKVQQAGCAFLRNFAAENMRICEAVFSAGYLEHLTGVLRQYLAETQFLTCVLWALRTLTQDDRCEAAVERLNLIVLCIQIADLHSDDKELLAALFDVLWGLSNVPALAFQIANNRGVNHAVRAFMNFQEESSVAVPALGVCRNLFGVKGSTSVATVRECRTSGGFREILHVLWEFSHPQVVFVRKGSKKRTPGKWVATVESTAVAEQALAALSNASKFGGTDDINKIADDMTTHGEFMKMRRVIENHPKSAMVQFQGFSFINRLLALGHDLRRHFEGFSEHVEQTMLIHRNTPVADIGELLLEEVG